MAQQRKRKQEEAGLDATAAAPASINSNAFKGGPRLVVQENLSLNVRALNESLGRIKSIKEMCGSMEAAAAVEEPTEEHIFAHLKPELKCMKQQVLEGKQQLQQLLDQIESLEKQIEGCQKAYLVGKVFNDPAMLLGRILPYVGVGHYACVGPVNSQFRNSYDDCVDSLQDLPNVVKDMPEDFDPSMDDPPSRPATCRDTFYSVAFSNVSCAELWHASATGVVQPEEPEGGVCNFAAKAGNLPVLKWAHEKKLGSELLDELEDTCADAAEAGNLEMLKWLREKDCSWDHHTCTLAAREGHLEVLKWACEHGCPLNKEAARKAAVDRGQVAVLCYLDCNSAAMSSLDQLN